jgi:putative transposase
LQLLDNEHKLSIFRQCSLIDIDRNKYYYKPVDRSLKYESAKIKIADIWNEDPSRGSRQINYEIKKDGYRISRKKIGELMREMGLRSLFAKPNLSVPDKQHKKYPYLLRGVKITHPNHVWSTDITYIKLGSGHVYLTAIIDWYSRKVLSWRLSNTLDNSFCIDALYEALCKYGKPDIFNTDQGSQYTASNFIDVLEDHDIEISMDGKGRATDNAYIERLWRTVKYGHIFLWRFDTVKELRDSLKHYFDRYNSEKGHMSLDYRTPDEVYYGMIEIGKEKIFA